MQYVSNSYKCQISYTIYSEGLYAQLITLIKGIALSWMRKAKEIKDYIKDSDK